MADQNLNQDGNAAVNAPAEGKDSRPAPKSGTKLLGPVLLIVVVVGSIGAWAWFQPDKSLQPNAPRLLCATAGCGFTVQRPLQMNEILPAKCPKCGNNSLFNARQCPSCRTQLVMDEDRGLPGPTKCPKCGTIVEHGQ